MMDKCDLPDLPGQPVTHISELFDKAMQPDQEAEKTVPCRYCGAMVLVDRPGEQYTVRCPSCGNKITLTRRYRERRGFVPSAPKVRCRFCRGTGIVEVPIQVDEFMHEYAFRCICAAGRARPETGIPLATDIDLGPLLRMVR
jgi:DNA-directed RNA polymerase subunit RPC12/RpoP